MTRVERPRDKEEGDSPFIYRRGLKPPARFKIFPIPKILRASSSGHVPIPYPNQIKDPIQAKIRDGLLGAFFDDGLGMKRDA